MACGESHTIGSRETIVNTTGYRCCAFHTGGACRKYCNTLLKLTKSISWNQNQWLPKLNQAGLSSRLCSSLRCLGRWWNRRPKAWNLDTILGNLTPSETWNYPNLYKTGLENQTPNTSNLYKAGPQNQTPMSAALTLLWMFRCCCPLLWFSCTDIVVDVSPLLSSTLFQLHWYCCGCFTVAVVYFVSAALILLWMFHRCAPLLWFSCTDIVVDVSPLRSTTLIQPHW